MSFIIVVIEYKNREGFKTMLITLLENAHDQDHG